MTPKQRAVAALTLKIPDMVPTFELEFQLEEEMFGRQFITEDLWGENLAKLTQIDKERKLHEFAEYVVKVYTSLEYSIIPGPYGIGAWVDRNEAGGVSRDLKLVHKYIRELVGDTMMIGFHGDGTFGIPDGNGMYEFAYRIVDNPAGVKAQAEEMCLRAIERNKALQASGVDCLFLCADYCFNAGPFISPEMFAEFVQPYLARIIAAARKDGLYTIKHTDGNIMPILDQLVAANPHALHSIDPMAGVDIREVKRMYGDKVCLCGNVHCAALQTGSDQDVIDSAEYCLTYAKPGGGYIFCTSNVPFKGMRPERYQLILDVWKRMRKY
ncbi:MAG: uroporphyrinogen decarboxylase family protein [bacterium]